MSQLLKLCFPRDVGAAGGPVLTMMAIDTYSSSRSTMLVFSPRPSYSDFDCYDYCSYRYYVPAITTIEIIITVDGYCHSF